ncbi:hypothetical protein [Flavobacterium cerinum]|uniref:Uncharacterized protein n=1 Tax=Flavobacterium cerinum TaxID=2502784 RepID=A0A3S3TVR8_9FLAO|nr:hypothetical protein [Flavobacterium cerinum]RWW92351.1 hypothetical protein EPI11_15690 [Flavobacterium cerinum]
MKLRFYPFILTAILAVINIFLLYRVINFDAKYEVLNSTLHKVLINKKLSPSEIEIQKIKEESYIRQQERDTTLILTVFALFAGFTAFLTFRSFSSKVEEHTAIIDKKYADHEAKNDEQHRRLSKLENDLNYEMYRLKEIEAEKAYIEERLEGYIFYSIYANYHIYTCVQYNKEQGNSKNAKNLVDSIKINLKLMNTKIDKVEINESYRNVIISQINGINEIGDHEIFQTFSEIYSKLEFKSEIQV